jgi:hypothetical protein
MELKGKSKKLITIQSTGLNEIAPPPLSLLEKLGLAKRVTRHDPFMTRLTRNPFRPNPDTTCLTKRVGAPDTTRPVKFHGSPDTTREPV